MYICDFCREQTEVLHVHDITICRFRKVRQEDEQISRARLRVGTCEKCALFEESEDHSITLRKGG